VSGTAWKSRPALKFLPSSRLIERLNYHVLCYPESRGPLHRGDGAVGYAATVKDKLRAHFAAGAMHVFIQPVIMTKIGQRAIDCS
jgi:hypothetical protein